MSSNPVAKPQTAVLKLAHPVNFEGVEHSEMTLRRLKGKDLKRIDGMQGTEATFALLQALSGWPPEAFDEMDAEDIEAASKIVEGFMGRRRRQ